jgi:hypothetical protein
MRTSVFGVLSIVVLATVGPATAQGGQHPLDPPPGLRRRAAGCRRRRDWVGRDRTRHTPTQDRNWGSR